jgi:hypothetical protein
MARMLLEMTSADTRTRRNRCRTRSWQAVGYPTGVKINFPDAFRTEDFAGRRVERQADYPHEIFKIRPTGALLAPASLGPVASTARALICSKNACSTGWLGQVVRYKAPSASEPAHKKRKS